MLEGRSCGKVPDCEGLGAVERSQTVRAFDL